MANRVFVSAVVILWLCSMTWLISDRILPSFLPGEPPPASGIQINKPISWRVSWAGNEVGRASTVRVRGIAGTSELHNRILLNDVPLMEFAPAWMRLALGRVGNITIDSSTRIEFDSLGNFSAFDSRVALNDLPSVLRITGRLEDSYLQLRVSSGALTHSTPVFMPNSKMLNESLFPVARIPYLREGRTWREEVYSPFRTPGNPIELIQAEVMGLESMEYNGEPHRVFRVEYRDITGTGVAREARLQSVSWIEPKGEVLRRDVYMGSSQLRFERLSEDESLEVGGELFERILPRGPDGELPSAVSSTKEVPDITFSDNRN